MKILIDEVLTLYIDVFHLGEDHWLIKPALIAEELLGTKTGSVFIVDPLKLLIFRNLRKKTRKKAFLTL